MKTNKNGFTLLELLVVIGIIAVLMALGAISYNLAQSKGRDSRRISDMKAIQNALEQYYANNGFKYPTTCSDATSFIKGSWPEDPYNGEIAGRGTFVYNGVCQVSSYCYCGRLEKATGNQTTDASNIFYMCGNNADGTHQPQSTWLSGTGEYYCVANLQ